MLLVLSTYPAYEYPCRQVQCICIKSWSLTSQVSARVKPVVLKRKNEVSLVSVSAMILFVCTIYPRMYALLIEHSEDHSYVGIFVFVACLCVYIAMHVYSGLLCCRPVQGGKGNICQLKLLHLL